MHTRSIPPFLVVAALLAPAAAAAWVVRFTCRDGIMPPLPRCAAGCSRPVRCDADEQCDGICTFAIRVCGEVACIDHLVGVPVGQREKIKLSTALGAAPTTFILRCRAHPPTIPCHVPSTSTTTVTTTSSTTLPGEICQSAADCDDGNPCTLDTCVNGECRHECLCVGPAGEVTCCPGPGPCPVPTTTTPTIPTCGLDPALGMCAGHCPPGFACLVDSGIEGAPPGCACVPAGCGTCFDTIGLQCTTEVCSASMPCRLPNEFCSPARCPAPCPPGSTSTTTTTLPGASCQSDADCNLGGNPCVLAFCAAGVCEQFCRCLHGESFTCSPEQADACQAVADCAPPLLGDPCRFCIGGLCMGHPFCV